MLEQRDVFKGRIRNVGLRKEQKSFGLVWLRMWIVATAIKQNKK